MAKWIPCGSAFVEGDDLRWLEAVWKPKERKTDKGVTIGKRHIVAQVIACGEEWADLSVNYCETVVDRGWEVDNYKRGEVLRRRRAPLGKTEAKTERKEWSDESARAIVASLFFRAEDAPRIAARAQERPIHGGAHKGPRRTGGRRGSLRNKGRRKTQLRP